jgi:hypothetical protein
MLEEKVHPDKPKKIPEQQKRQPAKLENSQQMNVNVPQQPKNVPQYLNIYNKILRVKFHDGKYPVISCHVWEKLGRPHLSYTSKKNEKIGSPGRYYTIMGKIDIEFTFKGRGSKDLKGWVPILVVNKPYVETEELEIHLGTNGGQTFDKWDSLYKIASKGPIDWITYNIKTKMINRNEEVKKRKDSKK